jgi:hypothetical protein
MNCPDAKTWNLLSMNLLDEERAESLRQHCRECERCESTWQEASRQHSELLSEFEAFGCDHDQRRDQLMAMLPEPVPVSEKGSDILLGSRWLGGIAVNLRRNKARWAVATLLPAVCILFASLLMTGEKVAFASMQQKMRLAKTMVCDVVVSKTVEEGQLPVGVMREPLRGTISMYFDGETRAELIEYEQANGKSRFLSFGEKSYVWDGDKLRVITSADARNPGATEYWFMQLLEAREAPDRELGKQMIDGRRAEGFEILGWKMGVGPRPTEGDTAPLDSDQRIRVWVDVEQNLPIRVEINRKAVLRGATMMVHSRFDNIKWNVPLDAADFEPPSEEEIAKAETTQIPAIDEAAFIDAMRTWLEWGEEARRLGITMEKKLKKEAEERGKEVSAEDVDQMVEQVLGMMGDGTLDDVYPERLDMLWLAERFGVRAGAAVAAKNLEQEPFPDDDLDKEEREKLVRARATEAAKVAGQMTSEVMLKASIVAAFYQKLANEQRDPEYFGATVKPGDKEGVLLRWKLDDGRFRVIYGDLRAETVD